VSRAANALQYPRRYAEAARITRGARAVAGDSAFDAAYGFACEIGITQQVQEIRWLYELLRVERPRRVLEIGLDEGGTLFLWTRVSASDAHVVSVDTRPIGPLGMRAPFPLARRAFAHDRQRVDLIMPADSHDPATRARVEALFAGAPVDFLFIDGDHSREGVWQDFRMYSPLVRPGGLVAFHDVSQTPDPSTIGVAAFWREFTAAHETEERVVGTQPGFGIGLYRVPG
jgi:predicted O-methyltransferase YrrM